jgi:hypothetical protein
MENAGEKNPWIMASYDLYSMTNHNDLNLGIENT